MDVSEAQCWLYSDTAVTLEGPCYVVARTIMEVKGVYMEMHVTCGE